MKQKMDNKPVQKETWEQKFRRHEFAIPTLCVAILLLIGLSFLYWKSEQSNMATPGGVINYPLGDANTEPATIAVLPEGSYYPVPVLPDTILNSNPEPNTTVKWESPKKIDDLKLIITPYNKNGEPSQENKVVYYKIGTHGSNDIVMGQAPAVDPSGPANYFFEKTPKGYVFMQLMSNRNVYHNSEQTGDNGIVASILSVDQKTYYKGLVGPETLKWSGITLEQLFLNPSDFFDSHLKEQKTISIFSYKKVADIPEGELYTFQTQKGGENGSTEKFYLKNYVLKLPSGFFTTYSIKYDFFTDTGIPDITWNDGKKNQDSYRVDGGGGCGNPGAYIVSAKDISTALKATGKTKTGLTIYEFADVNNPTLKYYYDQQNGQFYNRDTEQVEPISIEKWYSHHAVIALKNSVGEYVLMTNDSYGSAAECGKPVIYLYPTKPTNVSVKVGANITVSEPNYGSGWKVLAKPNGDLFTSNGDKYESLFWEGIGNGNYPAITEGFIVLRDQVDQTISENLSQLGLNQKESQDFKDFWLSKIPNSPYVRLTWFTTEQLDELAPLVVNPKPDTTIRVFLDFQGLSQPFNLKQQKLSSIPRNGFTLVEWGGLLRK